MTAVAFLRGPILRLILPFVAIIALQALLAVASLETLTAVRAYVGGEGLWSKGEKDAVHSLARYARTGDERYFRAFQESVAIPVGDRTARRSMEQTVPDLEAARDGFLRGGIHPDDISSLIWLFRNFHDVSYLATSIRLWKETDKPLDELNLLATEFHRERESIGIGSADVELREERVEEIGRRLAPLATAFSESLGAGSRSITSLLAMANILTAIALISLTAWRIRKLWVQRLTFENALTAEKERAQVTLASLGEAVVSTDAHGNLDYLNPAAERLIGLTLSEAKGASLSRLFEIVDQGTGQPCAQSLDEIIGKEAKAHRHELVRNDAVKIPVSITGAPLQSLGQITGTVLVLHDMTTEQQLIDRLSWQASHDVLTGLANRREFEVRVGEAFSRVSSGNADYSLMFLDLDQFKVVNDTCGHTAGDELLRQTSAVLLANLRDGDLLARLGGDEFGILLKGFGDACDVDVGECLRRAVQELRFVWQGRAFNISVSIGLVRMAMTDTVDELMRAADVACYMAKERGRNRVQLHSPSDAELTQRVGEMAWVQTIRNAIEEHRFCMYAQEIRSLKDDKRQSLHVELLLRLRSHKGEIIPPGSFMPAAERFGLMPLIDRWVVRNAFSLLAHRLQSHEAAPVTTCAINLSGATLGDDGFVDFVSQQFEQHRIPASTICFEITETTAISNIATARNFIRALKALGCRFALDDFGTGMSSISYLKHLPVDYIKIDGSFVRDMTNNKIDRAMVEMIARIGTIMGIGVIAEFVENNDTVAALRAVGVDFAQGYFYGRPEPFTLQYASSPWPFVGRVGQDSEDGGMRGQRGRSH